MNKWILSFALHPTRIGFGWNPVRNIKFSPRRQILSKDIYFV